MQALSKKGGAMWLFQEMLTCILSSFSGIYYIYMCVCVYTIVLINVNANVI